MSYNKRKSIRNTGVLRPCSMCHEEEELNEDDLCRDCFYHPVPEVTPPMVKQDIKTIHY